MQLIKRAAILVASMLAVWGAEASNERWMSRLPDTVKVCRVSIPGTHDSGTAGVRFPMRHYARTQTMDLSRQCTIKAAIDAYYAQYGAED